jgi:tetratricopeptide (TPR) repeat protein
VEIGSLRLGCLVQGRTPLPRALVALRRFAPRLRAYHVLRAMCGHQRALAFAMRGDRRRSRSASDEALRWFTAAGNPAWIASSLIWAAAAERVTGDYPRALERLGVALDLAGDAGSDLLLADCLAELALSHSLAGDHQQAIESAARCDGLETADESLVKIVLLAVQSRAAVASGATADALRLADDALRSARPLEAPDIAGLVRLVRAEALLASGERVRARAAARAALAAYEAKGHLAGADRAGEVVAATAGSLARPRRVDR